MILEFFDTNLLEETYQIDDSVECINKIGEICKEYRHFHAELEVLLEEQYIQDYTNSRELAVNQVSKTRV